MSPLSSLVVALYIGLIPIILVVAMVMAIRKRDNLGPGASNRLIAGAGLILLAHTFTALRPLLRNVIFHDHAVWFSDIANFINVTALTQFALQAAGLALIVAAVFTARQRTPAAMSDDADAAAQAPAADSASSMSSVWRSTAVIVAVVGLAAAGAWFWRSAQAEQVPPWRETEQQQAARCLDHYDELNLPVKAKPVERMLLRQNDAWLRLYVSTPNNWLTACHGTLDGMTGSFGTIMEAGPADKLRFFGGYDSVLKARLLLGHVPTGGAFIEARLANGQIIKGSHDDDIFVIWPPPGMGVEGAKVTVSTQDGVVIATAGAPADGAVRGIHSRQLPAIAANGYRVEH